MSALQLVAVSITVGLNALDGFDVLSISFASPGIATEWHVALKDLGYILSMELFGMAIGSIVLGAVADKIGRRPTVLGCLVLMSVGMLMVTTAKGPTDLSAWAPGHGTRHRRRARQHQRHCGRILQRQAQEFECCHHGHRLSHRRGARRPGGAGPVENRRLALGVLFRRNRDRDLHSAGVAVGTGVSAVACAESAGQRLAENQPYLGADGTRGDRGAAATADGPTSKASIADIFSPALLATTIIVTMAYFFHIVTFYFVLKWVPKIVVNMGFAASSATAVLKWANLGGACGGAVLGLLGMRYSMKTLTIGVMIMSTVMVMVFGHSPPDLERLSLICACTGFFTNGAIVGMYAIFAQAFPTHLRAFGTGFAIGIGRGGSALAPVVAGFLFQGGYSVPTVATAMSVSALIRRHHSQFPENEVRSAASQCPPPQAMVPSVPLSNRMLATLSVAECRWPESQTAP